jgi:hypothetical protein
LDRYGNRSRLEERKATEKDFDVYRRKGKEKKVSVRRICARDIGFYFSDEQVERNLGGKRAGEAGLYDSISRF